MCRLKEASQTFNNNDFYQSYLEKSLKLSFHSPYRKYYKVRLHGDVTREHAATKHKKKSFNKITAFYHFKMCCICFSDS